MNKELFGVFGDIDDFSRFRSPNSFDCVLEGSEVTVGVRDVGFGIPGRTSVYTDGERTCALWGEVSVRGTTASPAERVLERATASGASALSDVGGSYVAVVDTGDEAYVATDPARTWECYYTDAPGVRAFGTDALEVARTIPEPTVRRDGVLEFLHLGVVLGDGTAVAELHRVPFDGRLTADETATFDRFVYRPAEFDYVEQLAIRLERALERRARLPGRKGLLLSAGYDSRLVLAGSPRIDECYTVTGQRGREADVASEIAAQYGADHAAFEADGDYLNADRSTAEYTGGVRESIHVHHAGYADRMAVDTMYHGLLFDTFLRGHFLPRDGIDLLGHTLPRRRLASDFDPAEHLVTDKFGFLPVDDCAAFDYDGPTDSAAFAREALEREFERADHRYESAYDACAVVGIMNQPTLSFRTHLADNFLESFVAADAELVDWHLRTPPEHRNTRTFLRAMKRVDSDVLRHRPPDRPHRSAALNQMEQFVRARTPFLAPFENSWPDRRREYERADLDATLFPNRPDLHDLPVRLKLRINDLVQWFGAIEDAAEPEAAAILRPPEKGFPIQFG